jgi:toxin YhaV
LSEIEPTVINGWTIYAHPLFINHFNDLKSQVIDLKRKHPSTYTEKNTYKIFKAISELAFITIPSDPSLPSYRQGKTLGDNYKSWFRAKFFQQYRLFFRYHSTKKIIIYGWVNDSSTLRAYKSKFDAYLVFRKMLDKGCPPTTWSKLLDEAKSLH